MSPRKSRMHIALIFATLLCLSEATTLYQRKPKTPTLPIDHPRLLRSNDATSATPEQISVGYAGPGSVAVQWVTWPQDDEYLWASVNHTATATSTAPHLATSRKLLLPNMEDLYKTTALGRSSKPSHCDKMQQANIRSTVQYGFAPGEYEFTVEGNGINCYELGDYQSGAIHRVIIGGKEGPLPSNTTIYYRAGDPDLALSEEFTFTTAPKLGPQSLPYRLGLVGDLGQTEHSLSTLEHLLANNPRSVLFAGDLSYADGYQPRWDTWSRMMQPITATTVFMYTEGNHEQEHSDGPSDWLSYTTRFHQPYDSCRSTSPLYYSYEVAGMHIVMMGSYIAFDRDSEQYAWLKRDLASVDRSRTPWVVATMHAPWYNSNYNHQGEGEGMRKSLESMLYQNGVDAVISGHVHAYERSVRTFGYRPDECGPVYINIGDGGNREGLDFNYYEQPQWSAFREPSYGHGIIDFFNSTHAQFSWHRNQDEYSEIADEFWLIRGEDSKCADAREEMRRYVEEESFDDGGKFEEESWWRMALALWSSMWD